MWTDKRTTFHGKYFNVEDAILEPKSNPHPPIMIAGGGEQLALRVVARLADACSVFGSPSDVKQKFEILRNHCEAVNRPYEAIEKANTIGLLLARDEAALTAKRARLGASDPFRGFVGTVSGITDPDRGLSRLRGSAFHLQHV